MRINPSILLSVCIITAMAFTTSDPAPKVEWLTPTLHEFGDVILKEAVKHEFRFRNISKEPIVIDNVRPSCGCTIPDWEEQPIAPDSVGVIKLEYDSRDLGYFKKKIKVYFSGQRKAEILYVDGWGVKLEE
jgi:hypothetical protein